jgi:hypothetical protein
MKTKRGRILNKKMALRENKFYLRIYKQTEIETFNQLRQKLTIELFDQLHQQLLQNLKTHLKN